MYINRCTLVLWEFTYSLLKANVAPVLVCARPPPPFQNTKVAFMSVYTVHGFHMIINIIFISLKGAAMPGNLF